LEEKDARARIQPAGKTETGEVEPRMAKRRGLARHGEGMEINDGEDTVLLPLQIDPRADCPEVVSQGQAAGGLDAAEYGPGAHAAAALLDVDDRDRTPVLRILLENIGTIVPAKGAARALFAIDADLHSNLLRSSEKYFDIFES